MAIEFVAADGRPTQPVENYRKWVAQCGVLVRDTIPITIAEWNKPVKANVGASYVEQRIKDLLWDTLLTSFSLPEGLPENLEKKVKEWTLKKMAIQFNSWKKSLWKKYEKVTPDFTGHLEKIKDLWPEFVAYKKSAIAVA